jgi:hypothetical protein
MLDINGFLQETPSRDSFAVKPDRQRIKLYDSAIPNSDFGKG